MGDWLVRIGVMYSIIEKFYVFMQAITTLLGNKGNRQLPHQAGQRQTALRPAETLFAKSLYDLVRDVHFFSHISGSAINDQIVTFGFRNRRHCIVNTILQL
jgi:hypothetical protein